MSARLQLRRARRRGHYLWSPSGGAFWTTSFRSPAAVNLETCEIPIDKVLSMPLLPGLW